MVGEDTINVDLEASRGLAGFLGPGRTVEMEGDQIDHENYLIFVGRMSGQVQ